jgi:LysM repeat protein
MNINNFLKAYWFFFVLTIAGHPDGIQASSLSKDIALQDGILKDRILNLPTIVDLRYNDEVKDKVLYFVDKNKKLSSILLGRKEMYFPHIEAELKKAGLPEDLKYIPIIETGLVPYLSSHKGASGLWQFMPPTAERLGLKITSTVDERLDVEKSTRAAAAYLKRLFDIYHDWTLVLAAYNCGDGVVNKVIKKNKSNDYWKIQDDLPKQTQEFIPKFIAICYLMHYYEQHDISPTVMPEDYVYTAKIKIFNKVDLTQLATEYNIDDEVIRRLNAQYIKGFIPESDGEHSLTLPVEKAEIYVANYASVNAEILAYSLPAQLRMNNIAAIAEVEQSASRPGEQPIRDLPLQSIFVINNLEAIRLEEESLYKVVKLTKGRSLADIAQENGMELASLMEYNKISDEFPPKIGDQIRVRI